MSSRNRLSPRCNHALSGRRAHAALGFVYALCITHLHALDAPVTAPASDLSSRTFTAHWNASAGATDYLLDVFETGEDFADLNITANPTWTGNTEACTVRTDSVIPLGTAMTDGDFIKLGDGNAPCAMVIPSSETASWRFSLATSEFDPSGVNHFGVILMSDREVKDAAHDTSTSWQGYYLRIGASGADDRIQLRRKTGLGNVLIGHFAAGAIGTYGLRDGLSLRVTRSAEGVFELWTSPGFTWDRDANTHAGSLTDTAFNTDRTAYFGFFADLTGPERQFYIDGITLGELRYVAGYENRSVGNRLDWTVDGLGVLTRYTYRVRATGETVSPNSLYVEATTLSETPGILPPTSISGTAFEANWPELPGALAYELDVFLPNEDFSDGDLDTLPAWSGDLEAFTVYNRSNLGPHGIPTDGQFAGSLPGSGHAAISTPSTEVSEWYFSLASEAFDPSTLNSLGVAIMASGPLSGGIDGQNWTGYYLKLGDTGSDNDHLELWRKTGSGEEEIGSFKTPNFGIGGLTNGLSVKLTRTAEGVFSLYWSDGFLNASEPENFGGSLTNQSVTTSAYFGIAVDFDNPSEARTLYFDNLVLGSSLNIPPGLSPGMEKEAPPALVEGVPAYSEFYYRVRAVTAGGITATSPLMGVETLNAPPLALAASEVSDSAFTANWEHLPGATGYMLSVYSTNEDFDDGTLTAPPDWSGDRNRYRVEPFTNVPEGRALTDGHYLASEGFAEHTSLSVPTAETREWRFSWASGAFAPSTLNYVSIVLMASAPPTGGITGSEFQGYFLRLGDAGSEDRIELWRKTGLGEVEIGKFNSPVLANRGLADGLDIRVTRSTDGIFDLYYDTGFQLSDEAWHYAGSLTNALYTESVCFGICTDFGTPSDNRRVYLDNIVFGSSRIHLPGYENRHLAGTRLRIGPVFSGRQYLYQVRAQLLRALTPESNLVSVSPGGAVSPTLFWFR